MQEFPCLGLYADTLTQVHVMDDFGNLQPALPLFWQIIHFLVTE